MQLIKDKENCTRKHMENNWAQVGDQSKTGGREPNIKELDNVWETSAGEIETKKRRSERQVANSWGIIRIQMEKVGWNRTER